MLVNIYYKLSLFNAHEMILIVVISMNVNKPSLNQRTGRSTNQGNRLLSKGQRGVATAP